DLKQAVVSPLQPQEAGKPAEGSPVRSAEAPSVSKLAKHPRPRLNTAYAPPSTRLETEITAIWEEVLGVEQIGVNDNFFELGGHSLLGIKVVARLRDILQKEVSPVAVFEALTISELAKALDDSGTPKPEEITDELALLEQLTDEEAEQLLAERESVSTAKPSEN